MKKIISVLLAMVMLFSFSTSAFAASISYSNTGLKYHEEHEPGKYRFVFSYDDIKSSIDLSRMKEFYPLYRSAIGDPTKTIFAYFPSSSNSSLTFSIYVLENAKFERFMLASGKYVPWVRGDGFSLTVSISSAGKITSVSYVRIASTDSYANKISLGLRESGSGGGYLPIQGAFGHSSMCDTISGASYFELLESSDFIPSPTLTINYKYSNGTQAAESTIQTVAAGEEYKIASPAIPGYLPDKPIVSGTMPEEDLTVDVIYTKARHDLTIHYKYPDGATAAPSITQSFEYGAQYNIPSPTVEGYRPDIAAVSGAMPDNDLTVDVTYYKGLYLLNIAYLYEDGSEAYPAYNSAYLYGFSYSIESPKIEGFKPDKTVVEGVMPGHDLRFSITYREDSGGSPDPGGPGESEDDGNEPFYGYDAFHNPFDPDNVTAAGSNPFLSLWESIFNFSNPFESSGNVDFSGYDPFKVPGAPAWNRYDPFTDPFSSDNVDSNGKNPYSNLWEQIQGFSDPDF